MSWDASESWYTSCVGEKGHYYHQAIILPNTLKLLGKFTSLLDVGCGQGVLARQLSKEIRYVGIDQSRALIASAKKLTPEREFIVADASQTLPLEEKQFDRVTFILSLQNMEHGQAALLGASKHLVKKGKIFIVLNHPCFRIPRQSSWGIDEQKKLQYRRVDTYMSKQKIPIQTSPGKGEKSEATFSYHYSLSELCHWLKEAKIKIETIEEWCSDKSSMGSRAKMEDRARLEIPLFMAILGEK